MKMELRERLSVEQYEDNSKIFQLFSELLGVEIAPFAQTVNDFQNKITTEKEKRISTLKDNLQKMGIHGSSVLPNLFQDEQWFATEKALNNDFKQQLRKL
jgi:predicted HTH domain antitoxin